MTEKKKDESIKGRRRGAEPLEVRLTLRYRFGEDPEDTVTMMDDRAVPMVDSVFKNRDRILRALATTLVRAGATRPKVLRELMPGLGLLRGAAKETNKKDK